MVRNGQFRSDLYFRFNVFPVLLPPLRERREDIPALVMHFVESLGRRVGRQIDHIPPETMLALSSYCWPGNIRELQNLIERAVIIVRQWRASESFGDRRNTAHQRLPDANYSDRFRTRPDSKHA
jgi:transcriptional regulator with GAF, ATPase, and Fis domain